MPLKNPNTRPIQVGLNYTPAGPKFEEFHARNSVTRTIIGAMGGGKTTACLAEVLWLLLCSKNYQRGKNAFVIGRDHFQNRTKLLKDHDEGRFQVRNIGSSQGRLHNQLDAPNPC